MGGERVVQGCAWNEHRFVLFAARTTVHQGDESSWANHCETGAIKLLPCHEHGFPLLIAKSELPTKTQVQHRYPVSIRLRENKNRLNIPMGLLPRRRRPPCSLIRAQTSTMAQDGSPPHSRSPSKASSSRKVTSSPEVDSDSLADRSFPLLPIGWAPSIKYLVLFQVVAHAGMASWCASAFIPAFLQMSLFFHRPITDMTYLVGAYTLMMGFGVLLWNPLADRFGRRPILLISLSLCVIATCGVAVSKSYASIMVARIFQGFGICAPLSLGAAYMKEMYLPKDRGTALGVWTLSITCGPFLGPFVCGRVYFHFRLSAEFVDEITPS